MLPQNHAGRRPMREPKSAPRFSHCEGCEAERATSPSGLAMALFSAAAPVSVGSWRASPMASSFYARQRRPHCVR